MNKYSQGKIYKIVDNTNNNVYYGSTTDTLSRRLSKHKYDSKIRSSCRSLLIIKNGNYDIILIENYPCESKEQLETRERYYIENNECVNINIPGRPHKEWREENKEILLSYAKKYYKENSKHLREYKISWGGDPRSHNNLLKIDINLFK